MALSSGAASRETVETLSRSWKLARKHAETSGNIGVSGVSLSFPVVSLGFPEYRKLAKGLLLLLLNSDLYHKISHIYRHGSSEPIRLEQVLRVG